MISTLLILLFVQMIPQVPHFCLMKKFLEFLVPDVAFQLIDGGCPIRLRKGIGPKPCWYRHCFALLLSDGRAASCHCAASSSRTRVIDFSIAPTSGDNIIPRLDL